MKSVWLRKHIVFLVASGLCVGGFLFPSTVMAAEITGAFGYAFGESLTEKDIITRRQGMGPHDIIPKKKAGTVKTVQAYVAPGTHSIFALDGINSFTTMEQCTKMVTMITFFLGKKYADSVDRKENIGDGLEKVGVKFTDSKQGRVVMVSCTDSPTEARLTVRYGDISLTEEALKEWEKLVGGDMDPENGLSL